MDFDRFAYLAEQMVREVPDEFLADVVGVEVHRTAKRDPHLPEVFLLGECAPDEVTQMTAPEEMRSRIHVYHGSFLAVSRQDPEFNWEGELRETILHEIRHHIEDRAGIQDLRDEDEMQALLYRFNADEDLEEGWYRLGEEMEEDVWRVADDVFFELRLRPADLDRLRGGLAELEILEEPFDLEVPEDIEFGDTLSFDGEGLERPGGSGYGDLHVVFAER